MPTGVKVVQATVAPKMVVENNSRLINRGGSSSSSSSASFMNSHHRQHVNSNFNGLVANGNMASGGGNSSANHVIASSPTNNRLYATNPLNWTAKDVCTYLLDNKFDSHLVYLIEEHVIFVVVANF